MRRQRYLRCSGRRPETAIERNEFRLNYQAKINTTTGEIERAETLKRWNSEQLGAVGPGVFIPIAEESGTMRARGWSPPERQRVRQSVLRFGLR